MAASNLRHMLFLTAATTIVVVFLAGLQCADAVPVTRNVGLRDCDPNNNGVYPTPSYINCPIVITIIPDGDSVYPICRYVGASVFGDPWWLYVSYGSYKRGFVPDLYVNCGGGYCIYPICNNPMV